MRLSFKLALAVFVLVHATVALFGVDSWPLTSYPMYSTLAHTRSEVLHFEPVDAPLGEFRGNHMNWSLNGPPLRRPLNDFERGYVQKVRDYACPPPAECRVLRTRILRKEDGTFAFATEPFQP